jgi:hypothetical protein
MKTLHFKALGFCLFLLGLIFPNFSPLNAQDEKIEKEDPIVVFSYMKSKNGDYEKMEKEIWKPYMNQEIKNGRMLFWAVYDVAFPSGKNTEYDFVTINVYASIEQLENSWIGYEKRIKKVHPGLDLTKLEKRTEDSRDLVWNEAFRLLASADSKIGEAAKVIVANRMQSKPDKYNEYIRMELKTFAPAHKISVKQGYRKNWHFLSRAMPYGSEYDYDFMTFDSYDSMSQMGKATPANVWQDAHPDKDIEAIWAELNPEKLRILMRGEVWINIIYANDIDKKVAEK